jgi:WhiB family redox-sensing transcriptional regulator
MARRASELTPEQLPPERILAVADSVGGAITKLATLAVLDQTPDEFVSSAEICRRLDEAQGARPGIRFAVESRTTPFSYCTKSFLALDLVELGEADGLQGQVRGAKITPIGSALWPAITGAYMPWEQRHTQLSLQEVIGSSQQVAFSGTSTRVRAIEFLLAHPRTPRSTTEMTRSLDLSVGTVSSVLKGLGSMGLLESSAKHMPEERTFKLDPPTEMIDLYLGRMSEEVRAAVQGLVAMQQEGLTQVDGLMIIKKAKEQAPDLDPGDIWHQFLSWMKNDRAYPFVTEPVFAKKNPHQRTKMLIAKQYRKPLKDFVEQRKRLATDPAFFAEASKIGHKLMRQKKTFLAASLAKAKAESPVDNEAMEWETLMLEHVPLEGIDMMTLHNLVEAESGKRIQDKSFRKRIYGMTSLLGLRYEPTQEGVRATNYVTLKEHRYSGDWRSRGVCLTRNVDLGLFTPPETDAPSVARAKTKEATAYCARCPVRRACLKTAVENAETGSVWGGLTPEELQQLTPTQREKILATVTIGA